MNLLGGNTVRVNDNMSTFFGYDNSEGFEIKVKANRSKDIVITITDADDKCLKFTFQEADQDTLHRFEILMTNIFNIYDTFSTRFGAKQNKSNKSVSCSIEAPNSNSLTITANPLEGVSISINSNSETMAFLFKDADKDIFSRFRMEFTRLAANISNIKLPSNQVDKDHKHV